MLNIDIIFRNGITEQIKNIDFTIDGFSKEISVFEYTFILLLIPFL